MQEQVVDVAVDRRFVAAVIDSLLRKGHQVEHREPELECAAEVVLEVRAHSTGAFVIVEQVAVEKVVQPGKRVGL